MCPLMCSFMVQYINPLSLNINIQFLQTNLQIIFRTELASVVQKLDSAIHPIITIKWIKYLEIYPLDSAIHLLNNWGLVEKIG